MKPCLFFALALALACTASAESIVFPPDAGVVDVRAKYGAKGDGVTDDSAAIQKAIDAVKGMPDSLHFPFVIPDDPGRLVQHTQKVEEEAHRLASTVEQYLGTQLPCCALATHYASANSPLFPGVHRLGGDGYLVVTGLTFAPIKLVSSEIR
jgi:hypothetical protein